MSELKDYDIMDIEAMDDERLEKSESGKIQATRVYIKSEADNVISTIRAEREEYRYNLSCARNEIHNLSMSMREDVKRIADKDKVIAELKADYKEACDRLQTANLIKDEQLAAARHHKYKRCLINAKWCDTKADWYYNIGLRNRCKFYMKWRKRWLEIADKFKEAK